MFSNTGQAPPSLLATYWLTKFDVKIRNCIIAHATIIDFRLRQVCKKWKALSNDLLRSAVRARCKDKNKHFLSDSNLAWIVEIKVRLRWLQLQKLSWIKLLRPVRGSPQWFQCTIMWNVVEQLFVIYTHMPNVCSSQIIEMCDTSTTMARFSSWWISEAHYLERKSHQWIFCKPTQEYWQDRALTVSQLDYWLVTWLRWSESCQSLVEDAINFKKPPVFKCKFGGPQVYFEFNIQVMHRLIKEQQGLGSKEQSDDGDGDGEQLVDELLEEITEFDVGYLCHAITTDRIL